jgi:uncharacterized protein (TIGR02246 family)
MKLAALVVVIVLAAGGAARAEPTVAERWAKAWDARAVDDVVALYADDASFLAPDKPRVSGVKAIAAMFRAQLEVATATKLEIHPLAAARGGDVGYESGDYHETITIKGQAKPLVVEGSYVIVLRRAHGAWRIAEHVWTGYPAPASAQRTPPAE